MAMAVSPACAQAWHSGPRRRSASAEVGQCSDTNTSSAPPPAVSPPTVICPGPVPRTASSGAGPRPPLSLLSAIRAGSIVQGQPRPVRRRFPACSPKRFVADCANGNLRVWPLAATATVPGRPAEGSAGGNPACHAEQVLLAVQRVVVGPRPVRYVAADRLVPAERGLEHALAAGQPRELL